MEIYKGFYPSGYDYHGNSTNRCAEQCAGQNQKPFFKIVTPESSHRLDHCEVCIADYGPFEKVLLGLWKPSAL